MKAYGECRVITNPDGRQRRSIILRPQQSDEELLDTLIHEALHGYFWEILAEEAMFGIRIDSVKNPPWGIAGGKSGGPGRAVVNPGTPQERHLPPLSDGHTLRYGDILRIETGGGGGHGHPFDRPPEDVLEDVLGGFVSQDAARREYGVAIVGRAVDDRETQRLRQTRPQSKAFHRTEYVDVLS
jgi:N-methylhydantoinase B